jgi:hypothetical protein
VKSNSFCKLGKLYQIRKYRIVDKDIAWPSELFMEYLTVCWSFVQHVSCCCACGWVLLHDTWERISY